MASPDTTGPESPLPLVPLPPLLAAFLYSRVNPGAADAVAEAVLRVAAKEYPGTAAKGKPE